MYANLCTNNCRTSPYDAGRYRTVIELNRRCRWHLQAIAGTVKAVCGRTLPPPHSISHNFPGSLIYLHVYLIYDTPALSFHICSHKTPLRPARSCGKKCGNVWDMGKHSALSVKTITKTGKPFLHQGRRRRPLPERRPLQAKSWGQRIVINEKRWNIGLGSYPAP